MVLSSHAFSYFCYTHADSIRCSFSRTAPCLPGCRGRNHPPPTGDQRQTRQAKLHETRLSVRPPQKVDRSELNLSHPPPRWCCVLPCNATFVQCETTPVPPIGSGEGREKAPRRSGGDPRGPRVGGQAGVPRPVGQGDHQKGGLPQLVLPGACVWCRTIRTTVCFVGGWGGGIAEAMVWSLLRELGIAAFATHGSTQVPLYPYRIIRVGTSQLA